MIFELFVEVERVGFVLTNVARTLEVIGFGVIEFRRTEESTPVFFNAPVSAVGYSGKLIVCVLTRVVNLEYVTARAVNAVVLKNLNVFRRLGKAEVREVFKITGVGQVAGCYVTEGKIIRSGKLRIYRDDVMITEGNVLQLKRFKDDVKEVAQGFECGMSIEKFNDIKIGDFIECYQVEEQKD